MKNNLCNHRGSGLLVAIAMLSLLGIMGVAVTSTMNADSAESTNELQLAQALQVGNGGIEYAMDKIKNGQDPSVTDLALGLGKFSVTTVPATGAVTVTSTVGNAKKTQTVNTNFASNCVGLDVTPTNISGQDLQGMELNKTCNTTAIVTSVALTWNWSACAQGLSCTEDTEDDDDHDGEEQEGDGSDDGSDDHGNNSKITICHIPPGNPGNEHTISVSTSALAAHLAHGDSQGSCVVSAVSPVVCEGFDNEVAACGANDGDAHVTTVKLDANTVAQNITAASGDVIDITDVAMTENKSYSFDNFTFDNSVPVETWYKLTVNFADGSSVTKSFLLGASTAESESSSNDSDSEDDDDDADDSNTISVNNGYEVSGGTVVVTPNKTVDLKVIGSAITCGAGGKDINVVVSLGVNGNFTTLFQGDDVNGGEDYSTTTSASNVNYVVRGIASLTSCNHFSATYDSTNTTQVKTLINGQQAPALAGFGGQQSVSSFLAPYLDATGKAKLDANQVIMLFELGTSGSGSAASGADFQDLVVLFSITQ